ncbi:MAG: hypothetical protein GY704_05620, partial [Phycisphaeraceae bacterium]|nr:hypothetical protein [Phycisphaeraceae bacterium]
MTVRYVDVLRAVECAGGDASVFFLPWPHPATAWENERPRLPSPPSGTEDQVHEYRWNYPKPPSCVNVLANGQVVRRRAVVDPETCRLVFDQSQGLIVRADVNAPWSTWLTLYRRGVRPFLAAFSAEPGLPFDRMLDLTYLYTGGGSGGHRTP